jgi:DNA-binding response OmpR family regulator
LLRRWRAQADGTPVLMLHDQLKVEDKVSGLDTGADDLLPKPFALEEFLAHIRSLLRRRERPLHAALTVADLHMDRATREVTRGGRDRIGLSPKEFALLEYLLMRPDEVVSRSALIDHVWDDSFDSMSNVLDVTVHRLRGKIDGGCNGRLLHTIKGVGYVLHSRRT